MMVNEEKSVRAMKICKVLQKEYTGKVVGIEIGLANGDTSRYLLQNIPELFMYQIDPYMFAEEDRDEFLGYERRYHEQMIPYQDRIKYFKLTSADACPLITEQVDFVFIDGNHKYEHCKLDISLWWPKIKSGGILFGHDYNKKHSGVKQAFDDFLGSKKFSVHAKELIIIPKP